jgi:nucleotide-binding universal stress UspA family protein
MAPTRPDINRILCPVDFSPFSAPALDHALRLARWFEARVEVLHVIPFLPMSMAGGGVPDPLEITAAMRDQAKEALADMVEAVLGEGVPIETKLLEGNPWRVILDEAAASAADLVVMGTHGRSGFEHLLLGSVTEKVLRRATCPVLTVGRLGPQQRKGPLFRRILCAADLTQASDQTFEVALSLASENDARITLLHVIASLPGEAEARFSLASREIEPLRLSLASQARSHLQEAVPDAARRFCDVSERVETGTPWSEILRVASEIEAELIVMGAHTRGAVGRMLFGSTASQVVRRATCPVLIVRETQRLGSAGGVATTAGQLSAV